MKILKTGALFAGMLLCLGAQAELIGIEEAIETSSLRVSASKSGKGHVVATACRECPPMRLEMTPATEITVGGKRVPASKEISRNWQGGVVIYNVKTKQVVKLKL
ncbi:MAG: hypothetical protein WBN51_03520 [Gammaproteobacteria bacterium]